MDRTTRLHCAALALFVALPLHAQLDSPSGVQGASGLDSPRSVGDSRRVGPRRSAGSHPKHRAITLNKVRLDPKRWAPKRDLVVSARLNQSPRRDPDGSWSLRYKGTRVVFSDSARRYHLRVRGTRITPIYRASLHKQRDGSYEVLLEKGISETR